MMIIFVMMCRQVLYHCVDNSREYNGKDEQALEFGAEFGDAIQALIVAYPKSTKVRFSC